MHKLLSFLPVVLLAAMPLAASNNAPLPTCRVAAERELVGVYPDHPLSPQQSLHLFDTVFLGEVVVPNRKCSLGYCAGLRVHRGIKGKPGANVLLRIVTGQSTCVPAVFATKGSKWLVFANQGTSKGGLQYLDALPDGPSFQATQVPDFAKLEGQYRNMRAQLDQAIGEGLGRLQ